MALPSAMIATMVAALVALPNCVSGDDFLKPLSSPNLLEELEIVLGSAVPRGIEGRAARFEDAMRPIFKSLPKTSGGGLPWNGVRYLLHRSFVQRHGWQVNGIADDGAGFEASAAPSEVVASVASSEAAALFERRHGDRGLALHETAMLAAVLEAMVHDDVVDRLQAAYRVTGLQADEASGDRIGGAIDNYILMYLLRVNHTTATADSVAALKSNKHVRDTQSWARTVQHEVFGASAPELGKNFDRSVRTIEEVMDRYGLWQNYECENVKADLIALERNGTGRVRLQDFYGAAVNDGKHLFREKPEYLRDIGALDESKPSSPAVLIANFIASPVLCLGGTRFYAVCCINECEQLFRPLEEHIGAPEAAPERIAELVAQLGSSTVSAPRELPAPLMSLLQDIAEHHGGQVPLHGRLFAQWMHHAFPRECPYPHLAGTTAPLRGPVWAQQKGTKFMANKTELQEHIDQCVIGDLAAVGAVAWPGTSTVVDAAPEIPWVHAEELQVHAAAGPTGRGFASVLRIVAMLVVSASLIAGMLWTALTSWTRLGGAAAAPEKRPAQWGLIV